MILKIVLVLTSGILVSSQNGYPTIPAQTYPTYQQNGYANPPATQPSDIASYLQNMMVQNQAPSLNLSPSNIRQILMNRILSNQQIQPNFDQNSRAYGSNFAELPYHSLATNAVNGYSVTPMVNEYGNCQQSDPNKEDKTVDTKPEQKLKKTKKRKSKSKHEKSEKNHIRTSKNNKDSDLEDNDRETSKKTKKRSRKLKSDDSSHDNHTNVENSKKTKKKKRKNKENEVKDSVDDDDKVENPKPRRRHKKKPKSNKENSEKLVSEQVTTDKPTQIEEGLNVAHFIEGITEENRVPRNPIPESKDLFKSIPNLPENFANSFNFNGMSQFYNNNNPAMSNFFANYENIYQAMMAKNKGTNEQKEIKTKRPQTSRNNIKRKIKVRKSNSTTEANISKSPKPVATPKVNIVTTESTIIIKEKTRTNVEPFPKEESLKSDDKPTELNGTSCEIENEKVKDIESNIDDPVPNYGYIDDYYPQFTDSAAYTANKREVYIKNLGDTKYYYAVDKENPEFINKMRFEAFGLPERIVKDYEVDKKYDDAEKEGKENTLKPNLKEIKKDVVQFRSAPPLEIPDFQTRKVEKNENNRDGYYFDENYDYDARFLTDKASIYSEAKPPYYAETKENNKKILKDTRKDVETVFARSKVVNYGPVYNPNEDSTSVEISNQDLTDDCSFNDGGTTYVLATSLDYPESF